jgi:hypothetical protein
VVWPQNHSDGFPRFDLKTGGDGLASKPAVTVFAGLASKPVVTVFSSLALKLVATVSPVWAQNRRWVSWLSLKTKLVEGFSVCASKSTVLVW